jgi:hypothetical protein
MEFWTPILVQALMVYILSWFAVQAHVLDTPRHILKRDTPFFRFGGVHLLECRACIAFWVTFGVTLYTQRWGDLLVIWALSHVLRMQERGEDFLD